MVVSGYTLQTSTFSIYSRVEVLYNGRWGTVCNFRWGIEEGLVTCQELDRKIDEVSIPTNLTDFK